ncbi:hypothetical protein ACVWZA_003063 [Sphingomonas sp. UYAg733]
MRNLVILPLILAAACTVQRQPDNGSIAQANAATSAEKSGLRGHEPATSRSAIEAKEMVVEYFELIKDKKYSTARKFWGNDGADSGGDDAAFAATFTPYSAYQPKVGAPTEIKASGGMQYSTVAATLHVKRRSNGAEADRNGVVMLRRSIDPNDKTAEKRDWKIWGIDIRLRN